MFSTSPSLAVAGRIGTIESDARAARRADRTERVAWNFDASIARSASKSAISTARCFARRVLRAWSTGSTSDAENTGAFAIIAAGVAAAATGDSATTFADVTLATFSETDWTPMT